MVKLTRKFVKSLRVNKKLLTRYFGGIKLGANGLVRAYTDSVKEALLQAKIINLIEQNPHIIREQIVKEKKIQK